MTRQHAAKDFDPKTGKWVREFALAPPQAPLWMHAAKEDVKPFLEQLLETDPQWQPPEGPWIEVLLPSADELKAEGARFQPGALREQWLLSLVQTSTASTAYRLASGRGPGSWHADLRSVGVRFRDSPVWWAHLDDGLAFHATLWDVCFRKQGTAWFQSTGRGTENRNEEDARLDMFVGRPLWLLTDAMWDNAIYPPPVLDGPPFVKSVTVEAEKWGSVVFQDPEELRSELKRMSTAEEFAAMGSHDSTKDYNKLIAELVEQGWRVEPIRGVSTHYKAIPPTPNARIVHFAVSGDPRAMRNTISLLRKSGYREPKRHLERVEESASACTAMRKLQLEETLHENPISNEDLAAAIPWVKVERDPEHYAKQIEIAKEIGQVDGARKVFDLLSPVLSKEDQEVFIVVMLDVRGHVRDVAEVHRGGRSRVPVAPADVLRVAIASGCEGFIIVHNHPTGKADPSPADQELTDAIMEVAQNAEITCIDHVIVGMGQFYSFADQELYTV